MSIASLPYMEPPDIEEMRPIVHDITLSDCIDVAGVRIFQSTSASRGTLYVGSDPVNPLGYRFLWTAADKSSWQYAACHKLPARVVD